MLLNFGEAVRQFYGNYANADGRAQRSAYWWPQLYQLIIYAVLIIVVFMADGGRELFEIIDSMLQGNLDTDTSDEFSLGASGVAALTIFVGFAFANFLPNIMLNIRRFHDLGLSGWLVLGFFVVGNLPLIGLFASLANIVWFIIPGTNGSNRYGPDPLGHDIDMFG